MKVLHVKEGAIPTKLRANPVTELATELPTAALA